MDLGKKTSKLDQARLFIRHVDKHFVTQNPYNWPKSDSVIRLLMDQDPVLESHLDRHLNTKDSAYSEVRVTDSKEK